jgi:DNA-binding transcriptional regulator YhcF (GntR family)
MDFSKLKFRNGSSQPLYSQLLEALENAIESGDLAVGTRLPSKRALAEQLKISRTTVMSAYRELKTRTRVESVPQFSTSPLTQPTQGHRPAFNIQLHVSASTPSTISSLLHIPHTSLGLFQASS